MVAFTLTPKAITNGTYYLDEIDISPRRLVEKFGQPAEADGYKISGVFVFSDDAGNVFTLYDWKSTTLYEDNVHNGADRIPTPAMFWANESPVTLNIGGRENCGNVNEFKAWLLHAVD